MSFNILSGRKISYDLENVVASLSSLDGDDGFWLEIAVKDSPLVGKSYISMQNTGTEDDERINFLMKATLFIKQWLILNRHTDIVGFQEFVRKVGAYGLGDFVETPQQYSSSIIQ